jgi:hypothetical protein
MQQPRHQAHKLALLLDLNGTLIYRTPHEVTEARVSGKNVNGKWIYPRPGVVRFLEALAPRFTLYICTSMRMKNALHSLEVIGERSVELFAGVLDASYCKPDPDRHRAGGQEWDTIRDAQSVWDRIVPHDETSTLFVDNERRKCVEMPWNCLLVPEMSCAELVENSDVLSGITEYLITLATVINGEDVRTYIERHSVQEWLKARNPVVRSAAEQERISQRLAQVESYAGVLLEASELTLELIQGSRAVLIDTRHRLHVHVQLPLPENERFERRISLIRLLTLHTRIEVACERGGGDAQRLELSA